MLLLFNSSTATRPSVIGRHGCRFLTVGSSQMKDGSQQVHHHHPHVPAQPLAQEVGALCERGQLDRALDVVRLHTQQLGAPAIPFRAYLSLLKACREAKSLHHAILIHALLPCDKNQLSGVLGDQLVAAFSHCGALDEAHRILLSLHRRSIYSWRALISGFIACSRGYDALNAYQCMQEEGIELDRYTFVSLIKACTLVEDLHQAEKLHSDATKKGFTEDVFIGTVLVRMYGKCGSVLEAENLFDYLSERNVVSWCALLSVYVEQAQIENAVQLYMQMQDEGIKADQHTFVILLQACTALVQVIEAMADCGESLKGAPSEIGRGIHADARRRGLTTDVFVGCALVTLYGKCRSISESENVFDTLFEHSVVAWSALISAYVDQGQPEKALLVYRKMQDEGVSSDQQTFLITIPACGTLAGKGEAMDAVSRMTCLEIGSALHVDAQSKGFTLHTCVKNSLVSMYGKCGNIKEAESMFVGMSDRDDVSWNAMLSAYVEQGLGEKAFLLYRQMQEEDVCSVQQTFMIIPQACGILAGKDQFVVESGQLTQITSLDIGKALHADAWRSGFNHDRCVGNSFLSMYGKCGSIVEAENVFNGLYKRDAVSWNAMLSAYTEEGQGEKVLHVCGQMIREGVTPSQQTFVIALQACGTLAGNNDAMDEEESQPSYLEIGYALHYDVLTTYSNLDSFLSTALVCMYGKCRSIIEAENVFNVLSNDSTMLWNAMLSAYVILAKPKNALHLYSQMLEEGVIPDEQTYVLAFQACGTQEEDMGEDGKLSRLTCLDIGQALHADARKKGFVLDHFVSSSLICMYGKCGSIMDAENIFDGLFERNIVSWNAMLSVYLEQGHAEKALRLYLQMKERGVILNDITVVCALAACKTTGSVDICMQIHFDVVVAGHDVNPDIGRSLIRTYGDCARMVDAQVVFDGLPQQDVVSWTACIAGYAQDGNIVASLRTLKAMKTAGVRPNECTFFSLLSACTRAGLVDYGLKLFESMRTDFGLMPTLKHYITLIDLLGRVGEFKQLEHILAEMPTPANWSFWMCVLGACRTYGHVELGKQAFDNAVSLKPRDAAAYVLMSNIYADAGLKLCAVEVEKLRLVRGGISYMEENESDFAYRWQVEIADRY